MSEIDWIPIVEEFNDRYGTNFSLKSMLENLYKQTGNSVDMEKILGIHDGTIIKKMRSFSIPIQAKGGWSDPPLKKRITPEMCKGLSPKRLATRYKMSLSYAYYILKLHNFNG